jgi:hypothetical protein
MVVCACYPSYSGGIERRIVVQASLGIKAKIAKSKRAEGMAQQ